MDNPILYQAVGGLLIVFFLVMIYFFTRTWRWFHVVCVVFVFGTSIFLLRNTAAMYRTLDAWRTQVTKAERDLQRLEEEHYRLVYGETGDTSQSVESIRQLRARMARITLDLGRVWRRCSASPQADGTIVVNTAPAAAPAAVPADPSAPADAAAATPPAPASNLIQDQTILYVFLEQIPPAETGAPEGEPVPYYYLGEFVVVAATNTNVTLRPMNVLSGFDRQAITTPNATWSLYETMPVDGHEWFTQDAEATPNWNIPASEAPVFGAVDEKAIGALFEWRRFIQQTFSSPAQFQAAVERVKTTLGNYLRDGKPVANKDEYDPMNVWTKVRFLKPHKEVVDSGATVSPFAPGVTDDLFDRGGMAEVAILQLGSAAEIQENDVAVLPQEDAQKLIDQGICKFEEYVYVRRLNDYLFLFRDFDRRFDRMSENIGYSQREGAELQDTQAHVKKQLALASDEQSKLQQDLEKTKEEAAKIAAYAAALEKAWNDRRARLSQLFNSTIRLEAELNRRSQAMTETIRRRSDTTVAGR
jgi:hypothetical protein